MVRIVQFRVVFPRKLGLNPGRIIMTLLGPYGDTIEHDASMFEVTEHGSWHK